MARREAWPALALVACCFAVSCAPAGTARTYYVDPAGSDAADGRTPATAWRTVGKVNRAALRPGDQVLFKGGGVWRATLQPRGAGSSDAPVTFAAYGSGRPVLEGTRGVAGAGFSLEERHRWLVFRGFEVRGWHGLASAKGDGLGANLLGAQDIVFDDVVFDDLDSGVFGSSTRPAQRITIANSRILHIGSVHSGTGISLPTGGRGWVVRDTEIAHTDDSCVIDTSTGSLYLRDVIHDCGFGLTAYGTHGLYLKGPSETVRSSNVYNARGNCVSIRYQDATVVDNELHDCPAAIGWFEDTNRKGTVRIRRNRIWDADAAVYVDGSPTQIFDIANNTVIGSRVATPAPMTVAFLVHPVRGLRLENNVVTGPVAEMLQVDGVGAGGYVERANVFHSTIAPSFVWKGETVSTYAAYRARAGEGAGSTDVDPKLRSINPRAPDFSLDPSSPIRDHGVRDPATGRLSRGCDGAGDHFCGAAPEPGAVELTAGG